MFNLLTYNEIIIKSLIRMLWVKFKIIKIVVDHLGIDGSKVVPEAKFIDDLGADSLDTVELVMAWRKVVEIPDDAAETIQTVHVPWLYWQK